MGSTKSGFRLISGTFVFLSIVTMMICYVVLLIFVDPLQASSMEEGPECPGIITSPFAHKREEHDEEPSMARPHNAPISQSEDRDFIPFKILYLLDDTVSQETKTRLGGFFESVNERLSKIVRGRKVKDVRIKEKRYTDGCDLCDDSMIAFPEEFILRHPRCSNISNVPSERVKELNAHNYTLVVRVFVRWEGEGAKLPDGEHHCAKSSIAYAHFCPLADRKHGVDHGVIMYCNISGKTDQQMEATSLHETIHILAPTLVVHYPLENECEEVMQCENRIWKNDTRTVLDKDGQQVEKYSYLSIIDQVRDAARAYFDCPDVEGAELNSKWNKTTARFEPDFGHWSERLFPDELMSPKGYDLRRLSNLTLSVLAAYRDWYRVDMSKAEPLFHKITNGCDQLEKGCHAIVREQRQKQQPTFFQPYCDSEREQGRAITSHCSSDHKVQLQCHRLGDTSDECSSLVAFSQSYDHVICDNTTRYKGGLASGIGAHFGPNTICVTLISPPSFGHISIPVCVLYECIRDEKRLVLKFQPKAELGAMCFVNCSIDVPNRIVTGPKDISCGSASGISLICPDYHTICDPPSTTASTTSTSTTVTATTWKPGESPSGRGGTPAISTLPPIESSRATSAMAHWRIMGIAPSINIVVVWFV